MFVHVLFLVCSDGSLVTRCAEELPWLLKRAELKEQLFHAILNMDVLLHLYSRCERERERARERGRLLSLFCSGRTGELLAYWEYLRASVTEMALQYRDALARSEEGTYAVYCVHVAGNIAFGFAVWNHHTYMLLMYMHVIPVRNFGGFTCMLRQTTKLPNLIPSDMFVNARRTIP